METGDKWEFLYSFASEIDEDSLYDNLKSSEERYSDYVEIGKGAMKTVYSCMDNTSGRRVAMARLNEESEEYR